MLIDCPQVDDRYDLLDETPLHVACKAGNQVLVSLLIDKGADVNAKNKQGMTSQT